jgi:hypothetical protein
MRWVDQCRQACSRFSPDFELDRIDIINSIDDVDDLLFWCLVWHRCMSLLRQIEAIYSVPLGQRKYAINNQLASTTDVPFAHLVGRLSDLTRMDDSSCSLTP